VNTRLRNLLVVAAVVIIAASTVAGFRYYNFFESHVSTDDAYVDGAVAVVAPSVAGTIAKVFVEDNQRVSRNEPLLRLAPQEYEARVEQAQNELERANESASPLTQLEAADGALKLANSQLDQARTDFAHAREIRQKDMLSREYYDQAADVLRLALADLALATRQVQEARAALDHGAEDHLPDDHLLIHQAKAALDKANLDLTNTLIRSPIDGMVVRKSALIGDEVHPGEAVMAIVPVDRLFVTANFKETQLTGVRVGQTALITADLYPGYVYKGRVNSISAGTAAAFAVLPPENATGNWIKVVQRVPVKIVLDQPAPADKMLRLGLSVEVTVETGSTQGMPIVAASGHQ
jgi:membrane fusion protein (multidrug efflux system)